MNESGREIPPSDMDTNQPIKAIPEIPQTPPEMPTESAIVAPDTILYNADGTPKDTLITTPTGLENNIQGGNPVDNADVLRVARMEGARKEKGTK